MTIMLEGAIEDLEERVRAVMGVPELILTDDIISSPIFIAKAEGYINRKIKEYEGLDESLLQIAAIYYIGYLLCPGMYARLPKQMENTSTKTVLQNIDWDKLALDLLGKCNEIIDDAIFTIGEETDNSVSFAVLTSSSEYPNTNI